MTITLRLVKGSPLTHAELDGNFTDLDGRVISLESAPPAHTHTESDITDLSHDAVALRGKGLDATVGSPIDGKILVFRTAGDDWVLEDKPAGGAANLTDLSDVVITTPADNEVVAFDNGSGNFINQTPAEAGLAAAVHTHVLANVTDAGTFAALSSLALDGLSDVTITAIANNELLAYDTGTGTWINQTAAEAGLSIDLTPGFTTTPRATGNINLSGGTDGQVLTVQADASVAFEDASAHTHVVADMTDAGNLAALDDISTALIQPQAVTLDKIVDQGGFTAGTFTNANVTVSQEGIITGITSGAAGGGLTTGLDSATAIAVDDALDGLHKELTGATAITLTLDAQATIGTRCAFTPAGAGAVTVAVEAGAGYWLPGDNIGGSIRTTSFGLKGYGYFECIRNSDSNSAEWAFIGKSDHTQTLDANLDANSKTISNAVLATSSLSNAFDANDQVIGKAELKDYAETRTAPSSSAGTLTLDMANGNTFEVTLTENVTTLTISNPPATGKIGTLFLILKQDGTGGRTFAWGTKKWAGGSAPTISSAANAIDIYTLVTPDAGTTWYGFVGGQVFA